MAELGGCVLALLACYLGFACLALAMSRHWDQVMGGPELPPGRQQILRSAGFLLLSISLTLAMVTEGANFGSVLWVLALALSAAAIALTLTWRPLWLRPLARVMRS